jgi:hypothetical protein
MPGPPLGSRTGRTAHRLGPAQASPLRNFLWDRAGDLHTAKVPEPSGGLRHARVASPHVGLELRRAYLGLGYRRCEPPCRVAGYSNALGL